MSNKWRTTVTDSTWVYVRYSINPSEPLSETLVRKIPGVDKSVLQGLIDDLRDDVVVVDPYADNQVYEGTWTVKSVEPVPEEGGNLAGSVSIIQTLSYGNYNYAVPTNLKLVRARAYPIEQNENAWMYYERFKKEETKRWHNMTKTGVDDYQAFDGMRQIFQSIDEFNTFLQDGNDYYEYFDPLTGNKTIYYHRRYLNCIIYADRESVSLDAIEKILNVSAAFVGKYIMLATATWKIRYDGLVALPLEWWSDNWEEIEAPVIRECYYEMAADGTYNLYRTLEETSDPAIMRTRQLQYAGMTRVIGYPMEDDTVITVGGFNDTDEIIYENARFSIGGTTYRVLGTEKCSDVDGKGQVTLDITPPITLATEEACDEYVNQVQTFWVAL
jgi:hypothetical protein